MKGMNIMRKFRVLSLVIILLLTVVSSVHGETADLIIGEIVVKGLTRTDQQLVLEHLPVGINHQWSAATEALIVQTLFTANIFDPFSIAISTEAMTGNKVRVIIYLEDAGYFMLHPFIYVFDLVGNLRNSQFTQRIINPWGKGVSFFAGVNWKADDFENANPGPWQCFGFDFLGANGRVHTYEYRNFEEHKKYNQRSFELSGQRHRFFLKHFINPNLSMGYTLTYQNADYREESVISEQKYVTGAIKADLTGGVRISLGHGFALADGTDYSFGSFNYSKSLAVAEDKLLFSLKGGLATDHTPLSFQFLTGGYSEIPLRGHQYELAGNAYLVNNLEYRKQLPVSDLYGLVCVDLGKVAERGSDFAKADLMLDAGLGLGYDTPMGMLRLEVGFDLLAGGSTWNFWLVP
jgi:hypothetical protein